VSAWYAKAVAAGSLPDQPWQTWVLAQELNDGATMDGLGYESTLDGWAGFLRVELGLPLRLGAGCLGGDPAPGSIPFGQVAQDIAIGTRVGTSAPMGPRLGLAALAEERYALFTLPDGTLELRSLKPDLRAAPARLDFDVQDRPAVDALEAFNRLLANRGVPLLEAEPGLSLERLPPVRVHVQNARWREAAQELAQALGLELRGSVLHRHE
jgi:hypothetical protein